MDPDQPYHKRVELLVRCGLTSAVVVAGHQGIVIFIKHSPKHYYPSPYQYSKQHQSQHRADAWPGASALLFSSGDYGWMNVAFMLMGIVMAVIASTIINNMSDKRQYPIY
jgi:hypothetical protein